ncbi:MAG: tRNA nucleotidyltransferase [Bacillota bacterium]|nr:tRNA nucleotidyltransferase [Bacillota bacterium]
MKNFMQEEKAIEIARAVRDRGGRAYFVGGYVRDRLIDILGNNDHKVIPISPSPKDIDIEVHGLNADEIRSILENLGQVITIGKSFGIYSLKNYNIDIAMPRMEENTGSGHRDFAVYTDPFLDPAKAASRRDFTINALMEDVITGEIFDFFGGMEDLRTEIIRHVNEEKFIEDPLRVLRGAQFASRFDFHIAPETVELCRRIDLSNLPRERVEEELHKGLCKGKRPSKFFEALREMNQLKTWFKELEDTIGLEQNPDFHPEGDVWTHMMMAIDKGTAFVSGEGPLTENPYEFMLFVLLHDLGKVVTTQVVDGRIRSAGHEIEGMDLVRNFLDRITGNKQTKRYVINMVPLHMKPNRMAADCAKIKSTNRMFDEACCPEDLIYFAEVDYTVDQDCISHGDGTTVARNREFLTKRLEIYREYMSRPYVRGEDLIRAGMTPGSDFKVALQLAHKHRLAGVPKEESIKQILGELV